MRKLKKSKTLQVKLITGNDQIEEIANIARLSSDTLYLKANSLLNGERMNDIL